MSCVIRTWKLVIKSGSWVATTGPWDPIDQTLVNETRISTKSNQKSMEKYARDCIISIKQHQIRFVFSCLVFLVFFCCTVVFPKANRATRLKQIGANAWRWKKHGGSRISVWYWKSAMPKRILIISPLISWRFVFRFDSCHAAPRCLLRVSTYFSFKTKLHNAVVKTTLWKSPNLPRVNEVCTL